MTEKKAVKSIKKKIFRFLLNLFLVLLSVPLAMTFLFRDPMVQTLSARLATNFLTEQIGHEVRLLRVKVNLSSGISINGFLVKDHRGEPMIGVDRLSAMPVFGEFGLLGLRFRMLELDGAIFRYARYKEDSDYNLMMLLDKLGLRDTTTTRQEKKSGGGFSIRSRELVLRQAVFHFYDEHRKEDSVWGMDYADMRFEQINLHARRFRMIDDSLNLKIDSLSTFEQSGLRVNRLVSEFIIANSGLYAKNTTIELPNSSIDIDLEMRNSSYRTFAYFIDSVEMYGMIRPTTVDMSEIGLFAPELKEMRNVIQITGEVTGPVRDMRGRDLRLQYARYTKIHLDGRIRGLPDFFTSRMDVNIHQLTTTTCEIRSFRLPDEDDEINFTEEFDCNEPFTVSGTFRGSYFDFRTALKVTANEAALDADIAFTLKENDTIHFDAQLAGKRINLGRILHQEETLGKADMNIQVDGHGNTLEDLFVHMAGTFRSFDLLKYRYSRMRLDGTFYNDTIKATTRFGDRNMMMEASGYLSLSGIPALSVAAQVKQADLDETKLWPESELVLSGNIMMQMHGFDLNTTTASIDFSEGQLNFGGDVYTLRHALLKKYIDDQGSDIITLESEIADMTLSGKYRLAALSGQLKQTLNHYYDFLPVDETGDTVSGEHAGLIVVVKKSKLLEEQFLSGISFTTPVVIEGSFIPDEHEISLSSDLENIVIRGIQLRDNRFRMETRHGMLSASAKVHDIIVKDSSESDKSVFGLENFGIALASSSDSIHYAISWKNSDSLLRNSADMKGYLSQDEGVTRFQVLKSEIYVNDTLWTVNPDNMILRDTSGLYLRNVDIYGGRSLLTLAGKFPERERDKLSARFIDWNLSNFDFLTTIYNINMDGIANGDLEISVVSGNPAIVSNLTIDDFHLNREYLGTARLLNTWDNVNSSIFIKSQIIREGSSGRGEVLTLDGYYYPFREQDALDLTLQFNRIKLATIEPMVAEFVSHLEGQASGNLRLMGTVSKPVLTGVVDMRRAGLKVNYLNTKYSFSNEIKFREDEISFDELVIYDTLGNFASVNGSLRHNYFKNQQFDVEITTDKLLFFNTTRKMNDLYYGRAITSGNIKLSGSPKNIRLGIDIKTQDGTNVTLPLDYSLEISDKDYIIFVDHQSDSLELAEETEVQTKPENLSYAIDLGMEIRRNAKIRIYMPSDMGRIESQGDGNLFMHTNSTGDFTLRGDYVVESGIYHFSLGNVVSKRFELVRGGRISWTGDPYGANLNIRGLYRLKTSLSSLGIVIDSTADYKNKVNVHCYVILKNQLLNPDIRFEILFPNLDPDLQRRVYAVLDTTNLAVLNEQMISLLVLGSFSASNASNITLASSYYSVLTNQLSSMLSKISDDFDVDINYRPGDVVSQEEFEVALSTQLFDDRLIIDGQFGMIYDRAQQNASSIVGDVDLGYKLTRDGRWILKAFNHSNVNSWYNFSGYEEVSPYTQGVGIAFRKEFTNIAELFQRTRPRKSDKARQEEEEEDEEFENL